MSDERTHVVVVTGLSGAGKSTAVLLPAPLRPVTTTTRVRPSLIAFSREQAAAPSSRVVPLRTDGSACAALPDRRALPEAAPSSRSG